MEIEPLLPLTIPENSNLSSSLTPSQLKEYLIFGPPTSPPHPDSPSSSNDHQTSNLDWLVDPNIPLTETHLHKSKTGPAMAVINEVNYPTPKKSPKFHFQSATMQAFLLLMLYLSLGVVIYYCYSDHFIGDKTRTVVDALYFCIGTMCTIGYGDITPGTTTTKLFAIFFVLIWFGLVGYVFDVLKTNLSRKVRSELGVVMICIGIGVGFIHFVEGLDWLDSFYLSVTSVTTVGYGHRGFTSMTGRIFASIWLLVSTLAVVRVFLCLAKVRADRRRRRIEKYVLGQDMTVSQFLAADIDNTGFVSKSKFVIYKLKEMGKVTGEDIRLICKQFDRLDGGNCGKIALADVMEAHH